MKIIVDAFGGDDAPLAVLQGCVLAAKEYGVQILLAGDAEKIRKTARENKLDIAGFEILQADSVITMEDEPTEVIKSLAGCSMAVGLKALAEGRGDAFVSAGNTGALVVGSSFLVGRIKGIRRAALAPLLPSDKGCFMLMDAGANLECRPEMLMQFGVMGSVYMQKIMGVDKPKVGLVNVGTEAGKGTELQTEAYALLQNAPVSFSGNVEARDIPSGVCDVVVADGFTGNVVLKLTEGLGMMFYKNVKAVFLRNLLSKLSAVLVKNGLREFKRKLDYTEYGGAPLMGISKPVIKAHGSSNALAFQNAIRQAKEFCEHQVIEEIKANLPRTKREQAK